MIDIKELRIGNFVKGGTICELHDWCAVVTGGISGYHGEEYSKMEPIPLTEEWLLKMGFKDCNDPEFNEYAKAKMFFKGRIQIGIRDPDANYIVKHPSYYMGYLVTEMKYVHQVQNFNFSFTNEELTIKP